MREHLDEERALVGGPVCEVCQRPGGCQCQRYHASGFPVGRESAPASATLHCVGRARVVHIGATVDSPPSVATRCVITPASAMATRYAARQAIDLRT